MASIRAIVEADLLRAAIIIEAAVPEVKVEMAARGNIGEGYDVPRETLRILLGDLLALTGSGCGVQGEMDALEVGLVTVGRSHDSAGTLMVGDELDDWSRSGRGRDGRGGNLSDRRYDGLISCLSGSDLEG